MASARNGVSKDEFLPVYERRSQRDGDISGSVKSFASTIGNSASAAVLAYCLSSISMTLVNKYVVSGASWNLSFLYLAMQSFIGTVAILACKKTGLIQNLALFDLKKAQTWLPISLLLVGMIYTGNKALQFLSVPVYTIFKNLTIIVIAYGEVLMVGGGVKPLALLSFGLMVLSSVVAAWADIQNATTATVGASSDSTAAALSALNAGYAWMGTNVIFSASYALGMRRVIKKTNFDNWDVMFYNNLLSIPILLLASVLAEDWSSENLQRNFPAELRQSLFIGILYSGVAAVFISYCTAWCVRATSSTTYAMVGALNKLPLAVAGIVFFAAPVTFGSVSAIVLGFISGLVYARAKSTGA
ncbi:GDP-mannose transporter into the lumen of the Golgi [Aspergillus udagawae]|uniref:GDP-mannose transporter n=1 Tax=Aspergillus udagawae TaxID=91492 RepID=A0A8E0QL44_9EURO|nr:GDP-mannose transporter into the lumen of the Golgi [Aspergillus udagawae]GIC86430.1 GDP-mannose transporter into the lumen of the Golgi [Aspergillus udagawae]